MIIQNLRNQVVDWILRKYSFDHMVYDWDGLLTDNVNYDNQLNFRLKLIDINSK